MDVRSYTTLPHPTAFSGVNQLQHYYGIGAENLRDRLTAVDSYTRNREVKKPVYNPIFARQPRRLLQADLLDKQRLKRRNAGIAYWLVVIDTFTRFVWIRPLRTKVSQAVADAFRSILDEMSDSHKVKLLLTDQGGEFTAPPFRQVLRNANIKLIHPLFHAPHVERINRTLQSIIGKYLTEYATARFVDIVDAAVESYNSRRHRIIKMTPVQAERPENQDKVREALEEYYRKIIYKRLDNKRSAATQSRSLQRSRKIKFAVGDLVRKVIKRSKFFRAFHPTFEPTVYRVSNVHTNLPTTLYSLKHLANGVELPKKYYPRELQKVSDLSSFKITQVHENTRRRNRTTGQEEVRVSFEGLPRRYDKFVPVDSIAGRR